MTKISAEDKTRLEIRSVAKGKKVEVCIVDTSGERKKFGCAVTTRAKFKNAVRGI